MSFDPAAPRILVVEDSDEDYAAIERVLRRAALPVSLQRCTDADETISLLELRAAHAAPAKAGPALIVLDLNLPGRDGRYILRELRSREPLRRIPVVVFSTSNRPEDIRWCYENGANSYHVKDVDYETFKRSVENFSAYWLASATLPDATASIS